MIDKNPILLHDALEALGIPCESVIINSDNTVTIMYAEAATEKQIADGNQLLNTFNWTPKIVPMNDTTEKHAEIAEVKKVINQIIKSYNMPIKPLPIE